MYALKNENNCSMYSYRNILTLDNDSWTANTNGKWISNLHKFMTRGFTVSAKQSGSRWRSGGKHNSDIFVSDPSSP